MSFKDCMAKLSNSVVFVWATLTSNPSKEEASLSVSTKRTGGHFVPCMYQSVFWHRVPRKRDSSIIIFLGAFQEYQTLVPILLTLSKLLFCNCMSLYLWYLIHWLNKWSCIRWLKKRAVTLPAHGRGEQLSTSRRILLSGT